MLLEAGISCSPQVKILERYKAEASLPLSRKELLKALHIIQKILSAFGVTHGLLSFSSCILSRIYFSFMTKTYFYPDPELALEFYSALLISRIPFKEIKKGLKPAFDFFESEEDLLSLDLSGKRFLKIRKKARKFNKKLFVAQLRAQIGNPIPVMIERAFRSLLDLARSKDLPSVCLGHSKVFWSQCPVCAKLEEKARKNAS